ncbi:hypothetical protein TNCV_4591021 [Trichonephila clavipes]|nr:hypothetical protein TNCV_4591021 [Trichonephila clavipes]
MASVSSLPPTYQGAQEKDEDLSQSILRDLRKKGHDDDNVCTAPIKEDKGILEFVQSSKIFDADFDDENEMKKEAPVPLHHPK